MLKKDITGTRKFVVPDQTNSPNVRLDPNKVEALLSKKSEQEFYALYKEKMASGALENKEYRDKLYAYARKHNLSIPAYTSQRMAEYLKAAHQQARDAAQPAPIDPNIAAIGSLLAPIAIAKARLTGDVHDASLFSDYQRAPGGSFGTGVSQGVLPGMAAAGIGTLSSGLPWWLAVPATIGAGVATGAAQPEAEKFILGRDLYNQLDESRNAGIAQSPSGYTVGNLVGSALGAGSITGVRNPLETLNAARNYIGAGGARAALTPEEVAIGRGSVASIGAGAGLGGGLSVMENLIHGQPIDWPMAALNTGGGAVQGAITPLSHIPRSTGVDSPLPAPGVEDIAAQTRQNTSDLVNQIIAENQPADPIEQAIVQHYQDNPPVSPGSLPVQPNIEDQITAYHRNANANLRTPITSPYATPSAEGEYKGPVTRQYVDIANENKGPVTGRTPGDALTQAQIAPAQVPVAAPRQVLLPQEVQPQPAPPGPTFVPGARNFVEPTPEVQPNATKQVVQQQGSKSKRQGGNGRRQAAKAGGSNSAVNAAQGVSGQEPGQVALTEPEIQPATEPVAAGDQPQAVTQGSSWAPMAGRIDGSVRTRLNNGGSRSVFFQGGKWRVADNVKGNSAVLGDYDTRADAFRSIGEEEPSQADEAPVAPPTTAPEAAPVTPVVSPGRQRKPAAAKPPVVNPNAPVANGKTPKTPATIKSQAPPAPPNIPQGRKPAPEAPTPPTGVAPMDAATEKLETEWAKATEKRNYKTIDNLMMQKRSIVAELKARVFDTMDAVADSLKTRREREVFHGQTMGLVKMVVSDPDNTEEAAKLVARFMQNGVDKNLAEQYVQGIRSNAKDSVRHSSASGSLDMLGLGIITKKLGGFREGNEDVKFWKAAGKKIMEKNGLDPAENPLDALGQFRVPTSQISEVPNPNGLSQTIRQGRLERDMGEVGRKASQLITEAQRSIDQMKLNGKRRLDAVEQLLRGHAAGQGIQGKNPDQVMRDFADLVELDKTDPKRVGAHPVLKQALDIYDAYTEDIRKKLIDYQRNILGKNVPDDWGITAAGYFRHLFMNDYAIEATNPTTGAVEKHGAENYIDMLHKARDLEAQGYTGLNFTARDMPPTDPTIRIGSKNFYKIVHETMKDVGKDANGKWILNPDLVAEDYKDAIAKSVSGRKASTVKFMGPLLRRTNASGYIKEFRMVMNRYNHEVATGIEITKLRKSLAPLIDEMRAKGQKANADNLEAQVNLMAGKPTNADILVSNLLGNIRYGSENVPIRQVVNPLLLARNVADKWQRIVSTVALKSRPFASAMNTSGLLQQLLPRVGEKDFIRAALEYAKPATQERLRQIGVLDAATQLVKDPSALGGVTPVLVRNTKGNTWNPAKWFENASAMNRGIGYLYGEQLAKDAGLPVETQHKEGLTWAHVAEYNQGAAHMPTITQGSTGKTFFQFGGYTINNIEDWVDAVKQSRILGLGETRNLTKVQARKQLVRKVIYQHGVGGIRGFAPFLIGSGTYFTIKDYLHKRLGVEDHQAEHIARWATYGFPSLADIDASSSVGILPEMGDMSLGQLSPGISLAVRQGQGIKKAIEIPGHGMKAAGQRAEAVANATPLGKEAVALQALGQDTYHALYSNVTRKPILFPMRQGRTGVLKNDWDKFIQGMGAVPFKRTEQHGQTELIMNKGKRPLIDVRRKVTPTVMQGTPPPP